MFPQLQQPTTTTPTSGPDKRTGRGYVSRTIRPVARGMALVTAVAFAIPMLSSPAGADDGKRISVEVVGQGPPVMLIPGLTCDGSVWDSTVDRLKTVPW